MAWEILIGVIAFILLFVIIAVIREVFKNKTISNPQKLAKIVKWILIIVLGTLFIASIIGLVFGWI